MKIGLYDVDSRVATLPNLAIMKIASWHKKQGHEVEHYMPLFHQTYSKIYASKVFKFSDGRLITDDMIKGGTGIDMKIDLPEEINNCDPDYSFYNFPHSMGFSQRGCRFKCDFCVVPKKEGKPRIESTIEDIWTNRKSNFLILLDNDFFSGNWKQNLEEIKRLKLKVCFSQGMNLRIISQKQADFLAQVEFRNISNTFKQITFAWDNINDEKSIKRGFKRLLDAGIKAYQVQLFVLIGFDSNHEENLYRVNEIKSWGADPYVMPFDKKDAYQKQFARWVNHRAIFHSVKWSDYKSNIKKG